MHVSKTFGFGFPAIVLIQSGRFLFWPMLPTTGAVGESKENFNSVGVAPVIPKPVLV